MRLPPNIVSKKSCILSDFRRLVIIYFSRTTVSGCIESHEVFLTSATTVFVIIQYVAVGEVPSNVIVMIYIAGEINKYGLIHYSTRYANKCQ